MDLETMLLTIAVPSNKSHTQIAAMMLLYQEGQQVEVLDALKPVKFSCTVDAEGIAEQVAAKMDGKAELCPIHTIGCFTLDCESSPQ